MKKIILSIVVLCLSIIVGFTQNADADAVKKVIEDETNAFHFNDDRSVFLSYWNMTDDTHMIYSSKAGMTHLMAKDMKAAAEAGQIPKADKKASVFSNYSIRANGNTAWATFEQSSGTGKTLEFRCLEKINGQWKIVSSSIHSLSN